MTHQSSELIRSGLHSGAKSNCPPNPMKYLHSGCFRASQSCTNTAAPSCDSKNFISVESTAIDSELLECQDCKQAYEVKYQPDGTARLVSV
jgi:hypothetical protein